VAVLAQLPASVQPVRVLQPHRCTTARQQAVIAVLSGPQAKLRAPQPWRPGARRPSVHARVARRVAQVGTSRGTPAVVTRCCQVMQPHQPSSARPQAVSRTVCDGRFR
jgi:hypothetical protein